MCGGAKTGDIIRHVLQPPITDSTVLVTITKAQKLGLAGGFLTIVGAFLLLGDESSRRHIAFLVILVPSILSLFVTYKFIPPNNIGKILNTVLGLFLIFLSYVMFTEESEIAAIPISMGAILWIISSYPILVKGLTEQRQPNE